MEFILVRPLAVKVKAYSSLIWYFLGFVYQGANMLDLAFDLFSLALTRRRVVPLYTQVDARQFIESQAAHKRVRLGIHSFLSYNTSHIPMVVYIYGP